MKRGCALWRTPFLIKPHHYKLNSALNLWAVETDTSHSLAVLRMLVPFFSFLRTCLYSSCFFSVLLILPCLRPSRPPSAMYFARPELSLNLIFSRSISAHVPSTEIKMLRKGFLVPSGWKTQTYTPMGNNTQILHHIYHPCAGRLLGWMETEIYLYEK